MGKHSYGANENKVPQKKKKKNSQTDTIRSRFNDLWRYPRILNLGIYLNYDEEVNIFENASVFWTTFKAANNQFLFDIDMIYN